MPASVRLPATASPSAIFRACCKRCAHALRSMNQFAPWRLPDGCMTFGEALTGTARALLRLVAEKSTLLQINMRI